MAVNLGYVKSPQGILKILEFVSITGGSGGGGLQLLLLLLSLLLLLFLLQENM